MINENDLAVFIGQRDTGKERSSASQRKQIIRLTLEAVAGYPLPDAGALLSRHRAKGRHPGGVILSNREVRIMQTVFGSLLLVVSILCAVMFSDRSCSQNCKCGCIPAPATTPANRTPETEPPEPVPIAATVEHNLAHELAQRVVRCGSQTMSVDQVEEFISCLCEELAGMLDRCETTEDEILGLVSRYRCR